MFVRCPHAKIHSLLLLLLLSAFLVHGCRPASSLFAPKTDPAGARRVEPPAPLATIYVDEALLQKPYALIGGTVENTGPDALSDLVVEVELKRRMGGAWEARLAPVAPSSLAPGEKGRYLLKVLSEEWGDFRVVKLRDAGRDLDLAFKPQSGARRPPERVDGTRITQDEPPGRRSRGADDGDFINTPNDPVSVP